MTSYVLRRLPSAVVVLVGASVLIFAVIRLVPGDPASSLAGPDATPESVAAIRHQLGLDRSVVAQYLSWVGGVLTFDLGTSFVIGGDIGGLVIDGLGNTLALAVTAIVLAVLLAVAVSVSTVLYPRRWLTSLSAGVNTVSVALPPFVTGVLLVLVFAVAIPVLPAGGVPPGGYLTRPDITVQYLLLPAVCLALPVAAALTRFLTESLRTELGKPYIVTQRALGVRERDIVLRSALRNALPSMVTALGLQVGQLSGGAVLVEAVFAWPGIGQLIEQGVSRRDYPVVQVVLLLSVAVFVLVQFATDIVHAWLDPRIHVGART
ncbi:ABC transporter permease [Williamsia deligens]|uniref:ABC transporter permease n=1 Tax=Williamsia deligens TaxID=321325 RepID=A0ABW3GBD5_9NOCA|nr:ABC transporter permease [Williamsia deligens]MCP2192932.1 peptide/nickel transport system permease protein [Williamsia deligens]